MLDLNGVVASWNKGAERIKGYSADEILGRHFSRFYTPKDKRAHKPERELEIAAEIGRFAEEGWRVRKDGSQFWASVVISAVLDDLGKLIGFAKVTHDLTEVKRREDYTNHVAHHDFLTGLPNRILLADRLSMAIKRARRSDQKVAVLMLDLDHFKRVNDSLGHQAGDDLLKTAAERIKSCTRALDTVARMGGDEFVVVLDRIENPEDAERVAAKIVESVGVPMLIGCDELTVTASIGISYFPQDGEDANLLLKNADSAMYRAKAAGRRGYCVLSRDTPRLAQERLDVEHGINRALRDNLFRLHYQPQICLESGQVIGMEALLRWDDPVLGEVLPDLFIPIAEECGLIVPLGDWVIRTACAEARQLQRRTGRPLRLAVNVSPRQFRQVNLPDVIRAALKASGLAAESLELEITEGVFMGNTDETISHLREIRGLGAAIAIDDFGVGFSSLSYLTRFPIDTLKIDRSFVSKLPDSANDVAVVQAIIALATSLGIKLVAEGVETRQQLDFLRLHSCGSGRGGYLGKPMPAGTFAAQGFCFSKAVSAEAFAQGFHQFRTLGACSIAAITH